MTGPVVVGLAIGLLVRYPQLLVVALGAFFIRWVRRLRSLRRVESDARADVIVVARTLLVGLASGLPVAATLDLATAQVGESVGAELARVLRSARRHGVAAALAASEGRLTRPLLSRLALAQASGAPMSDAVAAFLSESRLDRRTAALEKVRRLPVSLMVPLGLLILPGFVVLFVGPIVLGALVDLFGAVP